jgi:hypothetical protein
MSFRHMSVVVLASLALGVGASCDGCPGDGGPGGVKKGVGEVCTATSQCDGSLACNDLNGEKVCLDPNDIDGDGVGNSVDEDIDGDGTPNSFDDDTDGDGVTNRNPDGSQNDPTPNGGVDGGDQSDVDSNGDGVADCVGAQGDCDNDGLTNNIDNDDNNDGIPDGVVGLGSCDGGATRATDEAADCDGYCLSQEGGFTPCDDGAPPGQGVGDSDGDGLSDPIDPDDDGDGVPDGIDPNPNGTDPVDPLPTGEGEGEGEGDVGQNCNTLTFNPGDDLLNPRIMLVVDKSGSMGDPDSTGTRKWDAARNALEAVATNLDGTVELGMITYPNGDGNNGACNDGIVRVDVGANHANQIINILDGTEPGGGTPTAVTLIDALGALNSLSATGGPRAVVLATDGGPNCNESLNGDTCRCVAGAGGCSNGGQANCLDDANAINAAQTLNAAGYPVFVVGEVGSENFTDVLNGLATAGGTAQSGAIKFYAATSQADLEQDLADIAIRVGACRIDLPQPVSAGQLTVNVGGTDVPQDTSRVNGWDLTDPDTVELFGQPCTDTVNGGAQATVTVQICDG